MLQRVPPSDSRAGPAGPDEHLMALLVRLPTTAAALHTVMTVGVPARRPLFRHVRDAATDMDRARASLMASVADLPPQRRGPSIRVAQTAVLIGSVMVAAARIAAQGRSDVLPTDLADRSRTVLELSEQLALTVPRQRAGSVAHVVAGPDTAELLALLASMSEELDALLAGLIRSP